MKASTPTKPTMQNWRRIVAARLRNVTKEQALKTLERIRAEGNTIFHADIRALTNGLNSQAINAYVIRKIGVKAGVIKEQK